MNVVKEVDHPVVFVDGREVFVRELIWQDGGRSFDVYERTPAGDCLLTGDESFDAYPAHGAIAEVLRQSGGDAAG